MEWLVSFDIKVAGIETNKHVLLQASNLDIAERGIRAMGGSWWPQLLQEDSGHWWYFPQGEVWFSAIKLLDDLDTAVLRGLNFLDTWQVKGVVGTLDIHDVHGNRWHDFVR
jgi:hypothetical protein